MSCSSNCKIHEHAHDLLLAVRGLLHRHDHPRLPNEKRYDPEVARELLVQIGFCDHFRSYMIDNGDRICFACNAVLPPPARREAAFR